MSREKNNSNGGNLRKQKEKEVNELLEIAKLTKDESAFQQKHHYKKFKDKYSNVDILADDLTAIYLCMELKEIKFFNESIFWCQKLVEKTRICDKHIRLSAFQLMTESFYCLEEYEKVVEYGKKFLDHDFLELVEPRDSTRIPWDKGKRSMLNQMKLASVMLNKTKEAMKYARESLKISVELYNAKRIEKHDILSSYCALIDFQIQLGDSQSAKKIFEKHLKLCNLNSLNLNDVLLALKEEGYEKIPPIVSGQTISHEEFAKKFFHSQESHDFWLKKIKLFHKIGKLCWLKHIVYFGGTSNLTWGNLSLEMYLDILKQFKIITEYRDKCGMIKGGIEHMVVRDSISMTLLLADQNHLKRENLFSTLFISIRFVLTKMKNISYYVTAAQRENANINLQRVMPFIQFCIKSLEKEGANSNENADLRWQFVTLRNSLIIMNHFKTNGRKEEY